MVCSVNNEIKVPNVSIQTKNSSVNFCSNPNNNLERSPEQDIVEINSSNDKQGLTTGQKVAIGVGLAAIGCFGVKFGLQHKIKNVYKNLKIADLPENIIFKKATTKEEALKFTKETLKIRNVEESMTLEELNYINKCLVDVSNAHKGKCVMPTKINYFSDEYLKLIGDGGSNITIAGMSCSGLSKELGTLSINKKAFENKYLDAQLKECYFTKSGAIKMKPNTPYKYKGEIYAQADQEASKLLEKYYGNPNSLTLEEKLKLIESRQIFENNIYNLQKGINVEAVGVKINSKGEKFVVMHLQPEGHSIYHEMGHLQDVFAKKETHISNPFRTEINMRRDEFNLFPTKTHKEFLNDKSIQKAAGKISAYAQTSKDEFVAEVYAGLVSGKKFPEDVMTLYKKYGGPMLG